jgi:hypothetical protein
MSDTQPPAVLSDAELAQLLNIARAGHYPKVSYVIALLEAEQQRRAQAVQAQPASPLDELLSVSHHDEFVDTGGDSLERIEARPASARPDVATARQILHYIENGIGVPALDKLTRTIAVDGIAAILARVSVPAASVELEQIALECAEWIVAGNFEGNASQMAPRILAALQRVRETGA